MRHSRIAALAMVAVMASLALTPPALAFGSFGHGRVGGRMGGGGGMGGGGRGGGGGRVGFVGSQHRGPHPGHPIGGRPSFGHRGFHHFHHQRFSTFGLPAVVYAAPPYYYANSGFYADPGYYDPPSYSPPPVYSAPAYYSPPPLAAPPMNTMSLAPAPPPPPSAPPAPSVVEFGTGRYELRGDGTSTPYAWVWIPNPPSSPPRSAEADRDVGSKSRLYRWTDEQGALHLTDNPEEVPPQYRTPPVKQAPTS